MRGFLRWLIACAAICVGASLAAAAMQEQKVLKNEDVVNLVKSGLPERTIIRSVQSSPNEFDTSPDALIKLHEAGVNEKIMEAMIAAVKKSATAERRGSRSSSGGSSRNNRLTVPAPSTRGMPLVTLLEGETKTSVPLERTTVAQSKAKASSLGAIAKDKAFDEAVKAGSRATRDAAGRVVGGPASQITKGVADKVLSSDTKTVTYVWMLPGLASQTVVPAPTPLFEVSLNNAVALRPEDYAPVIVQLTPAPSGNRLVGATEGKIDASRNTAADWPIYSNFIEDRVAAEVLTTTTPGVWRVVVRTALPAGEYAVVLRPTAKNKQFAGVQVARNQGDGIPFNSVWPFTVK
jgi:hypothetical protein